MTAGHEGDCLLVVHRHTREGLADVDRGSERVGYAVRALGVDVDQAHLHGTEGVFEIAIAAVALVTEPLLLLSPVDVFLGLPDIFAATGESEGLEPHRLERAVAGEDHQVGPREARAVLLLDRPEQTASLVEVGVVGPTVERSEPQRAGAGATAPVADPVGAGAVPGHPDEERTVVSVVGGPPILRGGHHLLDVALHRFEVELCELLGVVEVVTHRVAGRRVLVEDLQIELVGPPVTVGCAPHVMAVSVRGNRALSFALLAFHTLFLSGTLPITPRGVATVRCALPAGRSSEALRR